MKKGQLVIFNDELNDNGVDEMGIITSQSVEPALLELGIDKIEVDPTLQTRAEMKESVAAEYAELMREGHKFPPVVAFKVGEKYLLVDGFHRFQAQLQNGNKMVIVEIKSGTKRDAILFGIRANTKHGLSRSNADKRKAVELILADQEWNEWAYTAIAEACGVSDTFVRKVKMATSNGSKVGDIKKYERNGKVYSMDTAGISESRSAPIHVGQISLVEAVEYLEDSIKQLSREIELYKEIKQHEDLAKSAKTAAKTINAYCKLVREVNGNKAHVA